MPLRVLTLKRAFIVYACSMLLLEGLLVARLMGAIREGHPDFSIYYSAGFVARSGQAHHFYDYTAYFDVERQFAAHVPFFQGPLPFTHPPFEAWMFAPFSYLSYRVAYIAWAALNLVLLMVLVFVLRRQLPALSSFSPLMWMLAALIFFPVFFCLLQGQDAILLLLIYTFVYASLKNQRPGIAGAVLGAGLFKFHLVLPFLLLLLVQRRWRVLYGFVPVASVLAALSVWMVGVSRIRGYPDFVLHLERTLAETESVSAGMPSLRGLIYVLLPGMRYGAFLLVALSLAVLVLTARKCLSASGPHLFDLNFSLCLFATALVGYHVVNHDLSILMLPVFLLANYAAERRLDRWAGVLIVMGLAPFFFLPLDLWLSKQFALMGLALLVSMAGIGREMSLRTGRQGVQKSYAGGAPG